jgi:hypothetical protein
VHSLLKEMQAKVDYQCLIYLKNGSKLTFIAATSYVQGRTSENTPKSLS